MMYSEYEPYSILVMCIIWITVVKSGGTIIAFPGPTKVSSPVGPFFTIAVLQVHASIILIVMAFLAHEKQKRSRSSE